MMSGDIFGCYNLGNGSSGIFQAEARDAVSRPPPHGTAPQNRLSPRAHRTEAETPYSS